MEDSLRHDGLAFRTAEWVQLDRRLRVYAAGALIADTRAPRLLCQHGFLPVYYVPETDVRLDLLETSAHRTWSPYRGEATYASVVSQGQRRESVAWTYPAPLAGSPDTRGYWSFDFHSMDAWYEEDEPLRVHARDPYLRVDAVPSSRLVEISVGGTLVASSARPVLLFETGLVTRYYLPRADVREQYLRASDTYSLCPYKGRAAYASAVVDGTLYPDVAWSYRAPVRDVHEIAGHLAFWGEAPGVTLRVDGAVLEPLPLRQAGDGGELLKPARRSFRLPAPATMAGARPGALQHDSARANGRAEGPPSALVQMATERAGGRPGEDVAGGPGLPDPPIAAGAGGLTDALAFTFDTTQQGAPTMAPSFLDGTDRSILLEDSPRRVRTLLDGVVVADSADMRLLHEAGRLPVYGFPADAVREDALVPGSSEGSSPHAGRFRGFAVRSGRRTVADAAYRYLEDPAGATGLSELVFFDWPAMDAWFEEDEEVFKHARDPYHRIDTLHSSREIVVSLDGVELARSTRPRLLFETGLPTRYYLPRLDVAADVLRDSDTRTVCPYKGVASYHSLQVAGRRYDDLAWTYPAPVPEAPKIQGLIAFFNEKLDITVDGVLEARPQSPWS